eukprot:CFRG0796T1
MADMDMYVGTTKDFANIARIAGKDTFRLEPLFNDHRKSTQWAEIDRINETVQPVEAAVLPGCSVRLVHGILGVVRLTSGPYLFVITGKEAVPGRIRGHTLWRVLDIDLIAYNDNIDVDEETQNLKQNGDAEYISMIKWLVSTKTFLFSYSYDLTSSLQRQESVPFSRKGMPWSANLNPRFMWNYKLLDDFLCRDDLYSFVLPIIQGFVEIHTNLSLYGRSVFDLIVLTRRSRMRVGTRYNCRGIDFEGNVANCCEVEQIVQSYGSVASFVQTRGSVPLFWAQQVDIKYKPEITFPLQDQESENSFVKHTHEMLRSYGKVVMVDLIDQKGAELALGNKFRSLVKGFGNGFVRYIAFDFHKECKNMQWGHLSKLMADLAGDLDSDGFFFLDAYGNVVRRQTGVIRTNCIDCLDRTNVIQSMLAKIMASKTLHYMGRLSVGDSLDSFPHLDSTFKNVWANHADEISRMYTGTGALKTDFTRTGKRTFKGLLSDGRCSVQRYYLNNFVDGFRQDAMNLFVGNYQPSRYEVPLINTASETEQRRLLLIPIVGLSAAIMVVLALVFPHGNLEKKLKHVGLWMCVAVATWRICIYYGHKMVSRPKLIDRAVESVEFVPADYAPRKVE